MKITIENIEKIGFQKHNLFNKESFIYQKELGQSYEIRIEFYAKGVKSNNEFFDFKKKDDSNNWINYKYELTGKYNIELFSGDEFDRGYKLPLNINTMGNLKDFVKAFNKKINNGL
jgi:glutamine synthetase type III